MVTRYDVPSNTLPATNDTNVYHSRKQNRSELETIFNSKSINQSINRSQAEIHNKRGVSAESLRRPACWLIRFHLLITVDHTFFYLPDEVITYLNVLRPPTADWVFCHRDYPLVVFKQVSIVSSTTFGCNTFFNATFPPCAMATLE